MAVKLAVGSHCSLLAVAQQSLLAVAQKSTANSEQSLPAVTVDSELYYC